MRCCGVSIGRETGGKAITTIEPIATESSSVEPLVTTAASPNQLINELTTISSELDANREISKTNQSQTTLANEISKQFSDTTLPTDVTESAEEIVTMATVPRIQVPRKPDIYHIFPSSDFVESNQSDGGVDPNAPAIVVYAEKHDDENQEENKESNDIASTEVTVDLKPVDLETIVSTEAPIELKVIETTTLDHVEAPNANIEDSNESKSIQQNATEFNTVEQTTIKLEVAETGTIAPETIDTTETTKLVNIEPKSESSESESRESESDESESGESKSEESKSEESETEESKIEEPKNEEVKSDESKKEEPRTDEPESIESEPTTIKPEVFNSEIVESKTNLTDETQTLDSVTTAKPVESDIESSAEITTEPKSIESGTVETSTLQPKLTESVPTKSETVQPEAVKSQNVEAKAVQATSIEPETVKSEVVESETIASETVVPKIDDLTTTVSTEEATTVQYSSTEVDLETVEKSTQKTEVAESETSQPEDVEIKSVEAESDQAKTVEVDPVEAKSDKSETMQTSTSEPEILESKTIESVDESNTVDSTTMEPTTVASEMLEKRTEEAPSSIVTTETSPENIANTETVKSEAVEETTVNKSFENVTQVNTEKAVENENTEKPVETDTTVKSLENETTAITNENETTLKTVDITEKMIESQTSENIHESTENMIEITTSIPSTELSELKQLDLSTESLISSSTTERDSNVITTTVADVDDATVPDLITTMEATNMVEVRYNKRRDSIYHAQQTTINPLENPSGKSKINANRKLKQNNNLSVGNVVTEEIPSQSNERPGKLAEHKFTSAHKIPKRPEVITMEEDHKKHIMEVHSMLSSLAKIPARPPFSRSKSLRQLIDNEESLHIPNIANRKINYVQKNSVETTESIETSTQTEKPKRKYNRRLPVQKFSVGSIKALTTEAPQTTTELPNVNPTIRQRFNRRRLYTQPKTSTKAASQSNESTTVGNDVTTTKPNVRRLQNINSKTSLEKRKRLFEARRNGNTSRTTETPAITENAEQPEQLIDEMMEKSTVRNQYRPRMQQHRFKLKPERTSDDDSNGK